MYCWVWVGFVLSSDVRKSIDRLSASWHDRSIAGGTLSLGASTPITDSIALMAVVNYTCIMYGV